MKILSKFALGAVLLSVGTATPLLADTLAPNQTITPTPAAIGSYVILGSTGVQSFSFGGAGGNKDRGTVEELAVTFTGNPYGASDITFLYQFSVTAGDISSISGSDFEGFSTDVGEGSGSLPGFSASNFLSSSVSRSPGVGSNVHFDFNPNALPGDTSEILVINTSAKYFDDSTIGLLDSGGATLNGFEPSVSSPVPEPGSLLLLGTGLLGMGAAVRRRFSI